MRKDKISLVSFLAFFVCGVIVVFSIFYGIYIIPKISDYSENEVMLWAGQYSATFSDKVNDFFEGKVRMIRDIAETSLPLTEEELNAYAGDKVVKEKLISMQYLLDDETVYGYGDGYLHSVSMSPVWATLLSLISTKTEGFTEIYTDKMQQVGERSMAYYMPIVSEKLNVNGIIVSFDFDELIERADVSSGYCKYFALTETSGMLINDAEVESFNVNYSNNIFTFLQNISEDKTTINTIKNDMAKKREGAYGLIIDNNQHIVVTRLFNSVRTPCFIVTVYLETEVLNSEFFLYEKILIAVFLLSSVTIVILIVAIFGKMRSKKKIQALVDFDPRFGCSTFSKFIIDTSDIIEKYKYSNYSIVYLGIGNFAYLTNTFGKDACDDLLKFVASLLKKFTGDMETFGHAHGENFVVLLRCNEMDLLGERIKALSSMISCYDIDRKHDYKVKACLGVNLFTYENSKDIPSVIDGAGVAARIHAKSYHKPYVVFDANVNSDYVKEAEIEAKMDIALKNEDFKLFYQPKYNLVSKKLDSAEVLIRWYDRKDGSYIPPDVYVGLFERNGFITKLDYYVFDKACKFLHDMVQKGKKIVPVSVNVSRVTSMNPDFTSFYIKTKQKYNIPPNFITLEFTESFANESYDILGAIVNRLRENGFMCSIDDFGVGYSAVNILKELCMDELKIDKSLLQPSANPDRDDIVLRGIISMANQLGMKIVQEGIETIDELERVKKYGCEVIQGFYYSKPIHENDFVIFIENDNFIG